ncbi:signal recognition particle-docking protein FtsY [Oceanimonas sp. CHS3-5]|uniref:signal recognition particle-docking protein FtsY n=1 Tax=Oceanimonas sp. CHS3-5 TaxID=3068186 RepID=UPI00273EE494|nr:signal recognition particle-docking protein FtsY [Oceanimonas sp. CHS3-5]MDP5293253.1 signal recognition particle-docking protein FtsY [Oceanimonas sp. CHS3-5]
MAKKGFFSWLGFGKKKDEQPEETQEQQVPQDAVESEAEAGHGAEVEAQLKQQEAEAQAEEARLAAEARAAEEARLVAEARAAEEARLAAEAKAAEEAHLAAEAKAVEEARLAAEAKAAEEARLAAEAKAAEEARLAAEAKAAEEARLAAEAKAAEEARLAAEAKAAEEARLAAEAKAAEEARLAAEAKAAKEARLAAEAKAAEEARLAAEAKAAEEARLAAEAKAAEEARLAAEAKAAEEARLAAEEEARQAVEEEARLAAEAEAAEQQRLAQEAEEQERLAAEAAAQAEKAPKKGFFARLKAGLLKTRQNLGSGFFGLFRGKKIDDDLFEELETQLLTADLGVETTMSIIDNLTSQASRKQLKDGEALYELLKEEMGDILAKVDQPLEINSEHKPYVILMVGVNGVGKTTTIGKLARQFQAEGKSVMLAAGDTFRAAAVEQLQVWGERNEIPVIAQHTGADAASVIYDAVEAAKARKVDVLIADTAGRLQNKAHLMEELKKIVRVMQKIDPQAPHEIMLTLDAGTGQNALSQAKIFNDAVPITGITLSKLDGTAKGGVIFAVADKFGIPIRYIGVGEKIDDLRPFNASEFIEALFSRED